MNKFWKLLMMMCLPSFSFAEEGGGGSGGDAGGNAGGEGGSSDGGSGGVGDASGGEAGSGGQGGDQGGDAGGSGGEAGDNGKADYSTPEGYLTFARENGAFEKADQYDIPTTFDGVEMPESLASAWDVKGDADVFANMAAKHGLTQHQAEGIFKDYVTHALEFSQKAEQEGIQSQKPEVILKEVYGEGKVQESLPYLERGMKALGIDASKGLRTHHAMKAITELGRLTGEDGNFRNAGAGAGGDEAMSAVDWLKQV